MLIYARVDDVGFRTMPKCNPAFFMTVPLKAFT